MNPSIEEAVFVVISAGIHEASTSLPLPDDRKKFWELIAAEAQKRAVERE